MPKQPPYSGQAVKFLANNPHAELIKSHVRENEKSNKKLQLYYAIKANSW